MQLFATHSVAQLAAGAAGQLMDSRSFKVVEAVRRANGGSLFLAVTSIAAQTEDPLEPVTATAENAFPALDVETLSLPYALPS
jgi:hypothetical protein